MRVSVVQMSPSHDKADNLVQAGRLIEAAMEADNPDLVGLPEVWTCLGGSRANKYTQAETLPGRGANEPEGTAYAFLRNTARRFRIYVYGGSMIERSGEKLFNTTVVFDPHGAEIARYRKIHLFDVVAPDGSGHRESATYASGREIVTCEIAGAKAGCAICYDLRFPELFLALRQKGAELIFLPAAFTLQTGKDHWETLIRARAIETQCWFVAPATWGCHAGPGGEPRFTYGHSLICDPWGHVVARASDGIGWATARIDRNLTAKIRADMPVLAHRVLDRWAPS